MTDNESKQDHLKTQYKYRNRFADAIKENYEFSLH